MKAKITHNNFYNHYFNSYLPETKERFKQYSAKGKASVVKIFLSQTLIVISLLFLLVFAYFKNIEELRQINKILEVGEEGIISEIYASENPYVVSELINNYWYNKLYLLAPVKIKIRKVIDDIIAEHLLLNVIPELYYLTEESIKNSLINHNLDVLLESFRIYSMFYGKASFNKVLFKNYYLSPAFANNSWLQTRKVILEQITQESLKNLKFPLNTALYAQVIDALNNQSVVQQMFYNTVVSSLENKPTRNLCSIVPHIMEFLDEELCSSSIPYLYTKDGYKEYMSSHKKLLAKISVFADSNEEVKFEQLKEFAGAAFETYTEDYIVNYSELISLVNFKQLDSLDEALVLLKNLSAKLHIVIKVLQQIAALTFIGEGRGNLESISNKLPEELTNNGFSLPKKVNDFIGVETLDSRLSAESKELIVRELKELLSLLMEIAAAPDVNEACFSKLLVFERSEADSPIRKAFKTASLLPVPINFMYSKLIDNLDELLHIYAVEHINRNWKHIYDFYTEKIASLYPFNVNSTEYVALKDFSAFFSKGGMLDKFFSEYLTLKKLPIPIEVDKSFQFFNLIKSTWFSEDGKLQIGFNIIPLKLDPQVRQVILLIAGKEHKFDNAKLEPYHVDWPGANVSVDYAKAEFIAGKGHHYGISHFGSWGWYKLFELDQKHGNNTGNSSLAASNNILKSSFGDFEFEVHFNPNIPLLDITKMKLPENIGLKYLKGGFYDQ